MIDDDWLAVLCGLRKVGTIIKPSLTARCVSWNRTRPFGMDLSSTQILTVVCLVCIAAAGALWKPLTRRRREHEIRRAIQTFRVRREQLEAKFFDLASSSGKPRGLRWLECDWLDQVTFGRAVDSGLLTAFAGVNIQFEAIEDGDMEEVEAVGTIRDAVAIFHFHRGVWGTGGKALFNMSPNDALVRLEGQFVPVKADIPSGSP